MKKFNRYITVLFLFLTTALVGQTLKVVGDTQDNYPTKIKSFNDGIYIAGYREVGTKKFATFHKYAKNGDLRWETQLDFSSQILDFEYDLANDRFLLVGRTEPFDKSKDNQSLIAIVDNAGTLQGKFHQQYGREEFTSIVSHPNPVDKKYPYYILGTRNPIDNSPSTENIPVLWNIDADGNPKWIKSYTLLSPARGDTLEGEVHKGLIALRNGNVVLLGNATTKIGNKFVSLGTLSLIKGSGDYRKSYYYTDLNLPFPTELILQDGVELPSSHLAIVGQDSKTQEAFIAVTSKGVFDNLEYGLQFKNISEFQEIGIDNLGRLYAIGQEKYGTQRNVLIRFKNSNTNLAVDYAKYIDAKTEQKDPHFDVSDISNELLYTDARKFQASTDFDIFFGMVDLDFNSDCTNDFTSDTFFFSMHGDDLEGKSHKNEFVNYIEISQADLNYSSEEYICLDACKIDFSWEQISCLNVNFTSSRFTGITKWKWDFNGLGTSTLPNPNFAFPNPGTYVVCLTVTDSNGYSCFSCEKITILPDNNRPHIGCPTNILLYANENCQAPYSPIIDIDDCDSDPTISYILSNATIGTNPNTAYNKGTTNVTATVTNLSGNATSCSFNVIVIDTLPPKVICPKDIYKQIPICQDSIQVDFYPTSPLDNCDIKDVSYSHQSNDFFKCGETEVVYRATAKSGNTAFCSFTVNIDCLGGIIESSSIFCTEDSTKYNYRVVLTDNSTNGNSTFNCEVTVNSNQSGVIPTSSTIWTQNRATIEGVINISQFPLQSPIQLNVNLTCNCGNKLFTDTLKVELSPCCADISVEDTTVCLGKESIILPLIPNSQFNINNIEQTTWYISSGSSPTWEIWSSGAGYFPLETTSSLGNFCYYAEVTLNNNERPCTVLRSDTGCVKIVEPITECIITGGNDYCFSNTDIIPNRLSITNLPKPRPDNIQWMDENGDIPGETSVTYQPPALSLPPNFQECYKDFIYGVRIVDVCGEVICYTTIRLYNDYAPKGTLTPNKALPICYGDDLVLTYESQCVDDPTEWLWFQSTDGINYSSIQGSGSTNPTWNTNSLFQDTWYRIIKQNGVCNEDTIDLFVPIEPLFVLDFTATYDDSCDPTNVLLSVDVSPVSGEFQIDWYYNGQMMHTSRHTTTPVTYVYTEAALHGNYYVKVKDVNCPNQKEQSPVVTLTPTCELYVTGPCFLCNDEPVTLEGVLLNLPSGSNCSYTWTTLEGGNIINGNGANKISVDAGGIYILTANCGGCIKVDTFNLLQCERRDLLIRSNLEQGKLLSNNNLYNITIDVYPNPANKELFMQINPAFNKDLGIRIYNINGQVVLENILAQGTSTHQINIETLSSNAYWIEIQNSDGLVWREKFIKQ